MQVNLDLAEASSLQPLNVAQMGAVAVREPDGFVLCHRRVIDVLAPYAARRTWRPLGMPPILLAVTLKRSGNAQGCTRGDCAAGSSMTQISPHRGQAVVEGELRTQGQGWRGSTGWGTWAQVGGNWIAAQQLVDPPVEYLAAQTC